MTSTPPNFSEDELTDQGFASTQNGATVMRHYLYYTGGPKAADLDAILAARMPLEHPNLAKIIGGTPGTNQYDDFASVNTPYYPGELLYDITTKQALGKSRLMPVIRDMGNAAGYLHSEDWVHGDIDDRHVLLGTDGHTILLGTESIDRTSTPQKQRMIPGLDHGRKHVRSQQELDVLPETDIFALGMTALSAGDFFRPDYFGTTPPRYLDIGLDDLAAEHTLPKPIVEYLRQCISLSADRPRNGTEFLTGLDRACKYVQPHEGSDNPPSREGIQNDPALAKRANEINYQFQLSREGSRRKMLIPRGIYFPPELATAPNMQEMLAMHLARVARDHPTLMRMINGESLEAMTATHIANHTPSQGSNIWLHQMPEFADLNSLGEYHFPVRAEQEPKHARVTLGDIGSGIGYGAFVAWGLSSKGPLVMLGGGAATAAARIGLSVYLATTARHGRLRELACTERIESAREVDAYLAPHLSRARELLPSQDSRQYSAAPIIEY